MKTERTSDIETCQEIRRVVFIEGQNISHADEVDGKDAECIHFLLWDDGTPIATARVMPLGRTANIQRVAVLEEARGKGIGAQLMRDILADLKATGAFDTSILGAQTYAIQFYEKLGYTPIGPEYLDAGILHRDLTLTF